MPDYPQLSERVSVVAKVDKHETPSATYIHEKRRDDETPIEFLERITEKYPVLADFLSLTTYETGLIVSRSTPSEPVVSSNRVLLSVLPKTTSHCIYKEPP